MICDHEDATSLKRSLEHFQCYGFIANKSAVRGYVIVCNIMDKVGCSLWIQVIGEIATTEGQSICVGLKGT